jgi:adenosylcobinamide-GDP ribazoletransferase
MIGDLLRGLVAAFAFLTRLPVWRGPLSERDLGRAVGFFPLVGLVLGLVGMGLGHLLADILPPLALAAMVVALLAALTGALHLDGLADLFDGLAGGGRDRERALAIMRDSRIGAQGAVALVLVLILKVAAVSAALEARDLGTLLAFPAIGRWAVGPLILLFGTARAEGLAHRVRAFTGAREVLLGTVTLALLVLALGAPVALAAGVALAVALLLGLWLQTRLGGLTGDAYGAAIEIAEVAALTTAAAWR